MLLSSKVGCRLIKLYSKFHSLQVARGSGRLLIIELTPVVPLKNGVLRAKNVLLTEVVDNFA